MNLISTAIDSGWEFAERVLPGRELTFLKGGEKAWLPAQVPGHVHLDLMREGVIPDPFQRLNERGVRWVDEADWTYRTTFAVDAGRLVARGAAGKHFLYFHGLDTFARVYLNGVQIGETENFFTSHRFDVTEILHENDNELRVEFDSALRVGRERAEAYLGDGTTARGKMSYFNFAPRAFVRKPQYMFGWDWGPELVSCGIYQKVELQTVPLAEISDWRFEYEFLDAGTVDIAITITVEKHDDTPLLVGASLFAPGETTPQTTLSGGPGRHEVTLHIHDFPAVRWNPHGSEGSPKRYLLNLRLASAGESAAAPRWFGVRGEVVGFRAIEVIREPDPDKQGESFLFRVNGLDTFIKGANWIPDHSFPAAITEARLRERLTQARDAGFNMLRVWGGGLYETETFYDLCDALGIMVWQDFPFACSMYPDDLPEFREQVRQEATHAVRRLRHRACLALWCGGNENLELFEGRWDGATQATQFFGDALIHDVLPAVLKDEDTARTPYWPNSPYGGPNSQSEDYGDSHYWNVWHSKKRGSDGDWVNYAESVSRFSSEFGFASSCGHAAWESCTGPQDRYPHSSVVRGHDKTRKGYATFLGFIEKHFPPVQTLDDLVYYGQANQAMALQFGVEHWRRLKGRCWGTLFWQINDCWPTQSWAIIDSTGEPKAAYYAARRFYAPVLLSLVRTGYAVAAHLVNDTMGQAPGRLVLRVLSFSGEEVMREEQDAIAPANAASGPVLTLTLPSFVRDSGENVFIHAAFFGPDGETVSENFLLLAEPKEAFLPAPSLQWEFAPVSSACETRITLTTRHFAGFVFLRFEGLPSPPAFSDNWFHLAPGQSRTITVSDLPAGMTTSELQARLRVRHL